MTPPPPPLIAIPMFLSTQDRSTKRWDAFNCDWMVLLLKYCACDKFEEGQCNIGCILQLDCVRAIKWL